MDAKLTLTVDADIVAAAKRYAARQDTSVSQLVEDYLASLVADVRGGGDTPVLARLRGAMRGAEDPEAVWQAHLEEKYR